MSICLKQGPFKSAKNQRAYFLFPPLHSFRAMLYTKLTFFLLNVIEVVKQVEKEKIIIVAKGTEIDSYSTVILLTNSFRLKM